MEENKAGKSELTESGPLVVVWFATGRNTINPPGMSDCLPVQLWGAPQTWEVICARGDSD